VPFLDHDGVRLFFTDDGPADGRPALVFVHGWTCDSNDWAWQLSELSSDFRCVAMDLRGHGRSDTPGHGFRLADYADDVEALLNSMGVPAVLIGHSMGSLIASTLVDRAPATVTGLVVVDPPYGLSADRVRAAASFASRVRGADGVEQVHEWLHGADGDRTPPWLATWHRRRILAMPHHALIETVEDVHRSDQSIANSPNSEELWSRRSLPVLHVGTDPDVAAAEADRFTHPHSRAEVFADGAGHWLHQEEPARFNRILREWLDQLP
jgi:pimeloyl-ACP methyl ester carboxylesterase